MYPVTPRSAPLQIRFHALLVTRSHGADVNTRAIVEQQQIQLREDVHTVSADMKAMAILGFLGIISLFSYLGKNDCPTCIFNRKQTRILCTSFNLGFLKATRGQSDTHRVKHINTPT